jgi:TPR repeat protein
MYDFNQAVNDFNNNNVEASFEAFSVLASDGDAESQYFLALHYMEGDGVEKDMQKAIYWLKKAVKKSHVDAASLLMECDSVSTSHTNRF